MFVKAENDILGGLSSTPLISMSCIDGRYLFVQDVKFNSRAPCPDMTACKFFTCRFSAFQKASSSPDVCTDPSPRWSAKLAQMSIFCGGICGNQTVKPRILIVIKIRLQTLDNAAMSGVSKVDFSKMLRKTHGGICTKANAPRLSAGPQAAFIASVSVLIHSATVGSTQEGAEPPVSHKYITCQCMEREREGTHHESRKSRE
jgi:hypothetical protein